MATNKAPDSEKDNDAPLPISPEQDGLTADQAAEHNYSEDDAWDKSKNSLLTVLGVIVLGVVAYTWLDDSKRSEQSARSYRFLSASIDSDGAEERFLSFADEYDDTLSGVARYRAAVLQYRGKNYIDSAKNFELAAIELGADPLAGRALLGQAVSLLKDKNKEVDDGKAVLERLASSSSFLPTDRREAIFLLTLQSLSENDMVMVEEHKAKLADDSNASYFLSRIEDLIKTSNFLAVAKSMPDLNLEKGNAYLEKNGKRAGVISTDTGLQYEILEKGTGESPQEVDSVEVHYHGTLINGEVFDSSIERDEPASFAVNGVIKGWTEALKLMDEGAKWKLFIPSDLAYGESGSNSIGPNETLVFEVELLKVIPKKVELNIDPNSTVPALPPAPVESNQTKAVSPAPPVLEDVNSSKVITNQEGNKSQ